MHKSYDTELPTPADKSEQIRMLNDALRTKGFTLESALTKDKIMLTHGVVGRGYDFVDSAVKAVREFKGFTEDNDPYGEHDLGSFEIDGVKLFWKIDYYDQNLEYGSPDPADPAVTRRVLTILLAEEY